MARAGRIIAWAATFAAVALLFLMSGNTVVLVIAIAVVALPLLGWLGTAIAGSKVRVTLDGKTSAPKGQPTSVSVFVENASRIPLACVCMRLQVTNLLTEQERSMDVSMSVRARSVQELPLDLQSELCGRVVVKVVKASLFEVFRLFSVKISCGQERRLSVMPTLFAAGLRDIYAAAPLSDTTIFSPYKKGADLSEVFGLRDYEPGDELKRIHWKLSAKAGNLVVRDPSLPLDNSLMIFWDKGLYGMQPNPERADAMAEVVLAIAEQLAQAGVPFEIAASDFRQNRCLRSFITGENDIYEMIGQLMSSPLGPSAQSGLELYSRQFGNPACSRLIYVCAGRPAGMGRATSDREILLVVCDDGYGVEGVPPVQEIHFPASDPSAAISCLGVV